jgi:hypothetical protein
MQVLLSARSSDSSQRETLSEVVLHLVVLGDFPYHFKL